MRFEGATKASDFNQGEIIKVLETLFAAEGNGSVVKQQAAIIKAGFCYALSLEWLRLCQAEGNPGLTLIQNGGGLLAGKAAAKKEYAYFKQIANNFITYAETFGKSHRQLKPKDFLSPPFDLNTDGERDLVFLDLGTQGALQPTRGSYCTNVTKAIECLNAPNVRYCFFGFSLLNPKGEAAGGHQVAFARLDGKLYFFDPNAGVFEVGDAKQLVTGFTRDYFGLRASTFDVSYI